jgi:pseudouridine synthase
MVMVKERLQKLLARAGIASRRACEQLILDGRISVNKTVVMTLPVMVDAEHDVVSIDNKFVNLSPERKIYLLMNKPKGVVCTAKDEKGRKTVLDLLPPAATHQRVFPVGRLDKESQGLLLLTNDGDLTKKLTHPRYGIERVYIAEVAGRADGTTVDALINGIWLSEGKAKANRVKIIKRGSERSLLEITLNEGKNREVRRMLAKLSLPVKKLTRIRYGSLLLQGAGIGKVRKLTTAEIKVLKEVVNKKQEF